MSYNVLIFVEFYRCILPADLTSVPIKSIGAIMECSKCNSENPDNAKYCIEWGLYSALLLQNGDYLSAKEKINNAIEIYHEIGADGWAKKYGKELAKL